MRPECRYKIVLLYPITTYSHTSNQYPVFKQRNTSREKHDPTLIGIHCLSPLGAGIACVIQKYVPERTRSGEINACREKPLATETDGAVGDV